MGKNIKSKDRVRVAVDKSYKIRTEEKIAAACADRAQERFIRS